MALVYFRILFLAVVAGLLAAPAAVALARRIGLIDLPGREPHKLHDLPTPLAGGIALQLVVGALAFWQGGWQSPVLQSILISGLVVFFFGLLDDYRPLSPLVKLFGQALAAVVLISLGVTVRLFPQDWLNWALTMFWVIGVTNAYNFVDSTDGLALGLAALAAAFFVMVTHDAGQERLATFSAILLGTSVGLFYHNNAPARLFLGDSGSQLLGFWLAALAIAYNPPGFNRLSSWHLPILLLGVPLFDMALVIISRLRLRLPIYRAGLDHTYHRLVKLGLTPGQAALSMQLAALLLSSLAFVALTLQPINSNVIFGMTVAGGIAGILILERIK
jgi:UDP-GlcNAc:undecaprenyl-phosphate GlcNAc-1-phosphate transferase